VVTHLGDIQWLTFLVGGLSLVLVLACKKWLSLIPGSLVAVLLGTAASAVFGLEAHGVEIVGDIESGLPAFGVPDARCLSGTWISPGPPWVC
jgi:MFS superfamily sulfate permease-like transporter